MSKRKLMYENELKQNPMNYDTWFDYIRLEEDLAREGEDWDRARQAYDRAVANVPVTMVKRLWSRYVYIWLKYALFEELHANDVDRARDVYKRALVVIPHCQFTFAKVWLMYAQFEVR